MTMNAGVTLRLVVGTGKSYGVSENERVRARARELLLARYGNNKTAMATALKVSQATVSNCARTPGLSGGRYRHD